MSVANTTARISANKLGEFIVSKPRRQNRILYDQKYPADYIVAYYKEAQESISKFISSGMEDIGTLDGMVRRLDQLQAGTVYETRRLAGNIEAIETFINLLDDIDIKGAQAFIGENSPRRRSTVLAFPELLNIAEGRSVL